MKACDICGKEGMFQVPWGTFCGQHYYVPDDTVLKMPEPRKVKYEMTVPGTVAELRAVIKDLAEALIVATTTLEVVDPNAPSLEAADAVIGKHIRIIGPLIEEARKEKATDE